MILVPAGETERCAALAPSLAAAVRALASLRSAPALGRPFVARPGRWTLRRVLEGEERLLHAPVAGLVPGIDDGGEEGDRYAYEDPPYASSLLLRTGDLVVLAPADAWKAGCMAGGRHRVRIATAAIPA